MLPVLEIFHELAFYDLDTCIDQFQSNNQICVYQTQIFFLWSNIWYKKITIMILNKMCN